MSLLACAFCPATLDAGQHEPLHTASARPEPKPAAGAEKSKKAPKPVPLPLLPAGVTELKFSEFFAYPVGPRGLELTDTLKQLDGRRVRILGYMVRQESSIPGRFLLTPFPAHQALDSCLVDADRAVLDTIEFDRAVELCRQFATNHSSDTLVIVTADHECGGMNVIGGSKVTHADLADRVANAGYGTNGVRNGVVGTLEAAGFPRYTLGADGYPVTTDINYRMLMGFACDSDYYEDWITNPYPIANSSHSIAPKTAWQTNAPPFPADPLHRDTTGILFTGHIPDVIATHTATDIAVSAFGKGASRFTGQMDNTDVFFKVMQAALGDGESLPNGQFKLRMESSTTEGGPVIILMSTDLVNWNPIYTNEVPGALEFYRAKRQ